MLGQHRTKDRRREHQHEHSVEYAIVEQAMTGRAQRVVGDQARGERGSDLRQRQRPDRQLLIAAVAEGPARDPGGDPFADEQGGDDASNEQEVVDRCPERIRPGRSGSR